MKNLNLAKVHSFCGYVATSFIKISDLEAQIAVANPDLTIQPGAISLLTGIKVLPRAADDEQASDMAAHAARKLVATNPGLLIFASASQDISEPSTAHLLLQKLGLKCPVFDIKNACNSFLNGLEVAIALVESGAYGRVLVATGEIPSRVVSYDFATKADYKASFASFTLGDGGGKSWRQAFRLH